MEIFRVIATSKDDGYALSVEVGDGVPEDVFRKVLADISKHVPTMDYPDEGETVNKEV